MAKVQTISDYRKLNVFFYPAELEFEVYPGNEDFYQQKVLK